MSKKKANNGRPLTTVEQVDLKVAETVALDARRTPAKVVDRAAELGDQPPLIILSLGVAAFGALRRDERLMRTGLRMLAAQSLSIAGKLLGKGLVDRTRPREMFAMGDYRLEKGASKDGRLRSMPSGHSAGATAVALAALRDYPGQTTPIAAAAVAVTLAQLPSRNHFLTDVVAGAAIGTGAGLAASLLIPQTSPTAALA
jgi:undecaprenyl-diphosphatase